MPTVAINKEIFEFTCPQEKLAKKVQQEFVHYVATQLNNLILKIVSEQLNTSSSIRIDKIEIDLGDVLWPEFGQPAMLQKFELDFTQQISQLKNNQIYQPSVTDQTLAVDLPASILEYTSDNQSKAVNANRPHSQMAVNNPTPIHLAYGEAPMVASEEWELVQAFLLRGDLPWWADKNKPANLDAMVRRLINGQPQVLQNFLAEQRENSIIWLRLAAELKPATQILINQLLDGAAPLATVKSYWQKAGFTIPGFSFTKEQLAKLKAFFQRLKSTSADTRKAQLLQKLTELNSLGWMQQAALFDWLPEPEFKRVQAFFNRKDKATSGPEKKKVLAALQVLTPFQIEFLLYPTSLPNRPVTYKWEDGKNQPLTFNPELDAPSTKEFLALPRPAHEPESMPGEDTAREIRPSFSDKINPKPTPPENTLGSSAFSERENNNNFILLATRLDSHQLPDKLEMPGREVATEPELKGNNYLGENNNAVALGIHSKKQGAESRSAERNLLLDYSLPATTKPEGSELYGINSSELLPAEAIGKPSKIMLAQAETITVQAQTMLAEAEKMMASKTRRSEAETLLTEAKAMMAKAETIRAKAVEKFDQQVGYSNQLITTNLSPDHHSPAEPDKQLTFILKKLAHPNPAVKSGLQQLSKLELQRIREIFTQHLRHAQERRQLVHHLLHHPFLLSYNLLSILIGWSDADKPAADPVTLASLDTATSGESSANSKRRNGSIQLASQLKNLQSQVIAVLNNLTGKEVAVLQDIFAKAACTTQSEKNMLRRILTKLPPESLFFLQFLTELPAAELQQMRASAPVLVSAASENSRTHRTSLFQEAPTKVYVENAGLCLLAPYLPGLFTELNYRENKQLKNKYVATRALQVTQYLVTGKRQNPEYLLLLNKVLCGLKIEEGLAGTVRLTKKEITEADSLLVAVIEHWKALRNTSPPGFRESFLQRKGILTESDSHWTLQVERKGHDLLLNTIPWGFTLVKLPWMEKMLQVEW